MNLPILAITLGDPCGSGPEITAKALSNEYVYEICKPIEHEGGAATAMKYAQKLGKDVINMAEDIEEHD